MMRITKILCFVSIFLISVESFGQTLSLRQQEMMRTLDEITVSFVNDYAPLEWKQEQFGAPLADAYQVAKSQIENEPDMSTKDYQQLLVQFVGAVRDYHVYITFNDSSRATLPVAIRGFEADSQSTVPTDERRYFVVWLDKTKMAGTPLSVGDEIVEFDGVPISQAIKKQMESAPENTIETDHRVAEMMLTQRYAVLGERVPKGAMTLKVKKGEGSRLVALNWTYQKNVFPEPRQPKANPLIHKMSFNEGPSDSLDIIQDEYQDEYRVMSRLGRFMELRDQINSLHRRSKRENANKDLAIDEDKAVKETNPNGHAIGARKSYIPNLGKIVNPMPDSQHYHAYMYMNENNKLIGYVRIPDWMYPGLDGEKELDDVLTFFNENVDAVVIDQVNNPGGLVSWAYGFTTRFTTEAIAAPQGRFFLSHDRAFSYHKYSQLPDSVFFKEGSNTWNFTGLIFDQQAVEGYRGYYGFLYDELMEGKKLSDPFPYYGLANFNPHPHVNVEKPVLMLVNELSMSGGDFVPAVMQANGLAKIFGVRTRGAGGHTFSRKIGFNHFGVGSLGLTHSVVNIPNSQDPLENNGVKPDIPYQLTVEDIENNYTPLKEAINKALESMLDEAQDGAKEEDNIQLKIEDI